MPCCCDPRRSVVRGGFWQAERGMEPKRRAMVASGWSRRAMLGAALAVPFAAKASAQPYPSRNPRLIVPFAAGGPADILARIAAEHVSARLGQQIIVDSRP